MTRQQTPRSPYPSMLEVYRKVATAFDIKQGGDGHNAAKELDRGVREGVFDYDLPTRIIMNLMGDQLRRTTCGHPKDAAGIALAFQYEAVELGDWYLRGPREVPADTLAREEVLPILIEHLFLPFAVRTLRLFHFTWDGPALERLLEPSNTPVAVVLEWAEEKLALEQPIEKVLWPKSVGEDKQMRDLLRGWRRREITPRQGTINKTCRALTASSVGKAQPNLAPRLRLWLLTTRALLDFEKSCEPYIPLLRDGPKSLREALAASLPKPLWYIDRAKFVENTFDRIHAANMDGEQRFGSLPAYGNWLIMQLSPTEPKTADDERRLEQAIQETGYPLDASSYYI